MYEVFQLKDYLGQLMVLAIAFKILALLLVLPLLKAHLARTQPN
jgi:hypothetical protein